LEVVKADVELNLLLVRGPVPGAKNGIVIISVAVRPRNLAAATEEKK
jgi:ribosomal protein L3